MSDEIVIWHNPRCSKSRQTLQLLADNGVTPTIIEYLKNAPDISEIKRVLGFLGVPPRGLMRKKEAPYKDLDLANEALDEGALIAAMVDNPILIERPVVIKGDQAAIGRPPEDVLKLL